MGLLKFKEGYVERMWGGEIVHPLLEAGHSRAAIVALGATRAQAALGLSR